MDSVTHHGRRTAYRTVGDGPARILYVHGSGATHRLWGHQYAPDGPASPAVALDLSGHGESADVDAEPGPETLDAYAEDVVAVARETGADVLVGNSLGGAVVLTVALDTAFDPEGLVLAGTGAKLAVKEELRTMLDDDFETAVDVLHGENMLFHDPDDRTLARSKETMRAVGQRITRRDFLACHTFDVRDRLDELSVPALAVVGEHDSLTPPTYHEYLAEELPDCEYATIEGAAHLAMAERPDAFNDTVSRFLG
jgi:3-oxoadipate enol-lactonase